MRQCADVRYQPGIHTANFVNKTEHHGIASFKNQVLSKAKIR